MRLLLTSASVIALSYTVLRLLRMLSAKRRPKGWYKRDPEEVGRAVKEGEGPDVLGPEYDVVIIGGGTAGCALAARLSEDSNIKVLVLEAGGSGTALLTSQMPATTIKNFRTKHDYNLYTTEQPNAAGRKRFWPRGKLLGGCSSINAMMFHAGAPSDYDEWAKSGQEGASEWSFKEFQKYFLKFEKFVPHKLFPKVDASLRGASGPVQVGYFGNFSNFCAKWIDACESVGIPHVPDVNTVSGTLGATKVLTYIDQRGRRVSTEAAYLTPDVLARPNLTVATHAQVTRILLDVKGEKKRAVGVEFTKARGGQKYRVRARKEVVVSAGAVHTPHILMLSGIGPAAHLASHGIPSVVDLAGVGQHLMDHPSLFIRYRVRRGESLNYTGSELPILQMWTLLALARWKITGGGPLRSNICEAAAFLRSSDPALFPPGEFPEALEDTTSGENAPDIELMSSPFAWADHGFGYVPPGDLCSIGITLLRPTSLGTITLNSADPFDQPIIDPNYLATRHDLAILARGLKLALRIARTEPLFSLLDPTEEDTFLDHALHTADDARIENEVRERLETLYHPTSTARMAPREEGGVVDPYLRVYGVEGLRVADASVFPTIIAGHTAAPSIAVGEKAADIIKKSFKA